MIVNIPESDFVC